MFRCVNAMKLLPGNSVMTDSCEIPFTCSFESSRPLIRFMLLQHGPNLTQLLYVGNVKDQFSKWGFGRCALLRKKLFNMCVP